MRTPINSIHFYQSLLQNSPISKQHLEIAFKTPLINEAIYLESPKFHLELEQWFMGFIDDNIVEKKLHHSFLKYMTTLSFSCKQSGLFAASTIGSFSTKTHIELQCKENFKRTTSLDRTYVITLISMLLQNDLLKVQLDFYTNKNLYSTTQKNRIFDAPINNKKRTYMLAGAVQSNYIAPIIKAAKEGKTIQELSKQLMDSNITKADAYIMVNDLIHQKVLVSELEHQLNTENPLQTLINILRNKKNTAYIIQKLTSFQDELDTIDFNLINTSHIYKRLIEELKQVSPSINTNYLFKTNLFSTTEHNTLDIKIAEDLQQVMPILNKLTFGNQNNSLSNFTQRFVARYKDNEVPLTSVLNHSTGIGYDEKKTDNLDKIKDSNTIKNIKWTPIDDILLEKLVNVLNSPNQNIVLTDEDFKDFTENWNDLPDTISAQIQVIGKKDNPKIVINTIGPTHNANVLGLNKNTALNRHITTITTAKKTSNKKSELTEIVCPLRLQTSNLTQTQKLVKAKINTNTQTSTNTNLKVTFTDLMISVKNGTIYLRSKQNNRYIVPQFTQLENYPNETFPIYRFFRDLQTQNTRSNIDYNWNPIFQHQPFLPRVEYKNCILSKARWLIKTHTILNFFKQEIICLDSITKWRKSLRLPRYMELIENKKALLIDFENLSALKMLYKNIQNNTSFVLEESLITEEQIVKENGQSYNNEIIVSMHKTTLTEKTPLKTIRNIKKY